MLSKITIFEGPDGCGKTTAALDFARLVGGEYVHWGLVDDPFNDYLNCLLAYHQAPEEVHLVLDRFYPSETIYGRLFRGIDRLGSRARMLERVLWSHRAVVVKCLIDRDAGAVGWLKNGSEQVAVKLEQYHAVHGAYAAWEPTLPYLLYDWTDGASIADLVDALDELRPGRNLGPGAGHFRPGNILVVGEQPGGNWEEPHLPWPFVSDRGCSPFLAEALEHVGVPESALYFVSAWSDRQTWTDPSFLPLLRPCAVIGLGGLAVRWFEAHVRDGPYDRGYPFHPSYHPQYWRRFRAGTPYLATLDLQNLYQRFHHNPTT